MLIVIEGFSGGVQAPYLLDNWGSGCNAITIGGGRFGGNCMNSATASQKYIPGTSSTITTGIAFKGGSGQSIVTMRTTLSGTQIANVTYNASSSKLELRNASNVVLATGTTILNALTWYYIEVKVFINGASGTGEVHLNGATEIGSTTGNFGSTNPTIVSLEGTGNTFYCDMYVCDGSGSANNTFLGDCRVETLLPTADGANTSWTQSSGANHFSRVNETGSGAPDGDTSYVFDSTPGDIDTYTMADLVAVAGTVFGARTKIEARKDDSGARTIAPVIRQGSTNYVGITTNGLSGSYLIYNQIYEQDPSTSSPWDGSGINSAEVGIKEVS